MVDVMRNDPVEVLLTDLDHDPVNVTLVRTEDGSARALMVPKAAEKLPRSVQLVLQDLWEAQAEVRRLEAESEEMVSMLRQSGASWSVVGWCCGITGEGARLRYGSRQD